MRTNLIKTGATALLLGLVTASQAHANDFLCNWYGTCSDTGGGATAVPELDGTGVIAVVALLVSLVAVAYHRVKK